MRASVQRARAIKQIPARTAREREAERKSKLPPAGMGGRDLFYFISGGAGYFIMAEWPILHIGRTRDTSLYIPIEGMLER